MLPRRRIAIVIEISAVMNAIIISLTRSHCRRRLLSSYQIIGVSSVTLDLSLICLHDLALCTNICSRRV